MKLTLADLTPSERDALIACRARGLHRCPGGFQAHPGGKPHSSRVVMALNRYDLVRFRDGDTTQPGTCTVAGCTVLDGGTVRLELKVPA